MSQEDYRASLSPGTRFWGERSEQEMPRAKHASASRSLILAGCLTWASLGCTAQQWETTKGVVALTAVVGILALGESQGTVYRPVSTECHSVCTAYTCESRCVTQ